MTASTRIHKEPWPAVPRWSHIGRFHAAYPGRTIEQTSGVESNGVGIRWAWVTRNGDAIETDGMDFADLAPDGRIQRIAGSFGPLPPLGD